MAEKLETLLIDDIEVPHMLKADKKAVRAIIGLLSACSSSAVPINVLHHDGKYILLEGVNYIAAYRAAGKVEIAASVTDDPDILTPNLFKVPEEQASYRRLLRRFVDMGILTYEQVKERFGVDVQPKGAPGTRQAALRAAEERLNRKKGEQGTLMSEASKKNQMFRRYQACFGDMLKAKLPIPDALRKKMVMIRDA